jgi:hypothetical protein
VENHINKTGQTINLEYRMKKSLVIWVLVVAVATMLVGCQSGMKTYSGEFGGLNLTFEHPADWQINTEPGVLTAVSDASLFTPEVPISEGSLVQITTIPVSALVTEDLLLLMNNEMSSLRQFESAQIVEEATAVQINGRPGLTAVLRSPTSVYNLTMLETDTTIVFVLGETLTTDPAEDVLDSVNALIDSITVGEILQ